MKTKPALNMTPSLLKVILTRWRQAHLTSTRKRCVVTVVTTCLFLLPVQSIWAQSFYVDPCALRNGNGSQAAPFNMLANAVAAAKAFPGSKIIMKGGFYPKPMTISDAVTLTAYDGSAVVGTGRFGVGWRDVSLNLSSGESTNARVYYPSWTTGKNAPIASPCAGGFPGVVYAHGKRDIYDLCSWSDDALQTDNTKDYLQAEGLLKPLASSGFIAISFDWHSVYNGHYNQTISPYMIDAITYLGNEFAGSADLQRIGLIGHSTGGSAAVSAAELLRNNRNPPAVAVGLLAPGHLLHQEELPGTVLVIHGTREHPCQVGLAPLEIYCEAAPPKHLIVLEGANHFGYTDGICLDPNPPAEGECDSESIFDPYGLNPRDYFPNALGWDNSSEVGGVTGQQAHALQQLAAANYLQAFFSYYLQNNASALDYLVQSSGQQCGHPGNVDPLGNPGACANDLMIDPPQGCDPIRYFDDLKFLNVGVKVCSCTQ